MADWAGFTPLMRAAAARQHAAVERLLAAGADPEKAVDVAEDEDVLRLLCGE